MICPASVDLARPSVLATAAVAQPFSHITHVAGLTPLLLLLLSATLQATAHASRVWHTIVCVATNNQRTDLKIHSQQSEHQLLLNPQHQ
jgi:hypothetical protein